jgi:hypothetical protein
VLLLRDLAYPLFISDAVLKLRLPTRSASRSVTFWLNLIFNGLASVVIPYDRPPALPPWLSHMLSTDDSGM